MTLRPGTVFANAYEIVRPLSAGGMGVVYEVVHRGTRRRRALKVMLAHIVTDPVMRERFALEAVVTADIESEHLTEIFDAGIDAETDCPYLVMELLRGEDLGARIKRGDRCSAETTLILVEQLTRALDKTHARGIVHRDLKPENLFITERDDGTPRLKILDFGIAKLVKSDQSGPQATTKTFGTPHYMAREQITGESALIGPASDLYAVGQIVFALLTGRPYFDDEARASEGNILSLLLAVGRGPQEKATARALRRGVELPASFDVWFQRATAPHPRARFSSASEMCESLRLVLREPVRWLEGIQPAPLSNPSWASPARASSERIEPSYPSAERAGAGADSVRRAEPQSIEAVSLGGTRKRASFPIWAPIAALAGIGLGIAVWRLTLPPEPGATAAGTPEAPKPIPTEVASAKPASPLVAAEASASAAGSVAAAEPPAPTASASAAPAAAPARPPTARPGAQPPSGGPEVWEIR